MQGAGTVLVAERRERSEAKNNSLFETTQYFINIYMYIRLSARALHKTMHALRKSYYVGPLCIVLRNTGCCSEHHFEESPFE